ncbi:MAG: hypothetical protein NTZ07_04395 [Candidatus Woesebacteria bacterium]|nr:hypothetical protein [Candidatus Woesebacteria bacterium]
MGKEIIVIDPDVVERQLIQKPAKAGEVDTDFAIELPGEDADHTIMSGQNVFGK